MYVQFTKWGTDFLKSVGRIILSYAAIALFVAITIVPNFWWHIPRAAAIDGDLLNKIRDGVIYVRSDGSNTITVTDNATGIGNMSSWYIIKNPNGTVFQSVQKTSAQGSTAPAYSLVTAGDYQIVIPLPSRVWSFSSQAPMVLQPNPRKMTFRDINDGQSATRMYFNVPDGTTQFTFYAMATRGVANAANQAVLYDPSGVTHTTLDLTIDTDGQTWSSQQVTSPESGMWSASINVEAASNDSEGTYWLEGIDNYFTADPAEYFVPQFINGDISVNIDPAQVVGDRGLFGTGRVHETNVTPTAVRDAFLDIGLEANEVVLNHANREVSNDNGDPNDLNAAGYNFNNQAVEYTVNTLGAEPILALNGAASWLVDGLSIPSCGSNRDCKLQDASVQPEWAEYAQAVMEYYNITNDLGLRFIRVIDEPIVDTITYTDFINLYEAVASRLAGNADPRVSSVQVYSGAFSDVTDPNDAYTKDFIDNVNTAYHHYLGYHPWMLGYGGLGDIYTPPFLRAKINEYTGLMEARENTTPKKVIISEVNAKFGDANRQDEVYYTLFDHSLWWWSMLFNSLSDSKTQAILYYPFEDNGTIHNSRGMVFTDGTYKPVAYAAKYFLANVEDNVIETELDTDVVEVEAFTTASDTQDVIDIMLVNKEARTQNVDLNISFATTKDIAWTISNMDDAGDTAGVVVDTDSDLAPVGVYQLPVSMVPHSLYNVRLLLTDPENQAPEVNAGSDDVATVGIEFNLDGTVSDDGLPNPPATVTTEWTQQSGPGTATFGDANAIDTTVEFDTVGEYVLRLTADDSDLSAFSEITITVGDEPPDNSPPSVNAGTAKLGVVGEDIDLDDGIVNDDGLPNPPAMVTTEWTQQSGPGTATFGDASLVHTTVSFDTAGVYVLRLTADDSELTNFNDVTVTVSEEPTPTPTPTEEPTPTPTPTSTPTPTPTATPTPTPNNQSSSNSYSAPEPAKPPSCGDWRPIGLIDLFQITRVGKTAKLYFTPVNDNVNSYHVIFGFKEGDERFGGISLPATKRNEQGVQMIEVSELDPQATYAFKVVPTNGCATGEWSNWLTVKPNRTRRELNFYRYFPTF